MRIYSILSDWTSAVVRVRSSFMMAGEAYESSRLDLFPTETLRIPFASLRFNPISEFSAAKSTACLLM